MFDPMSELSSAPGNDDPLAQSESHSGPAPKPAPRKQGGGGQYGTELHSITVRARQRTFYIDLKESSNGKFFKISEKSRGGKKSTIVFDVEDLGPILDALKEMQGKI